MLGLSALQCLLLAFGQMTLKIALERLPSFSWTKAFWVPLCSNWLLVFSGLLFTVSTLLWMYILRQFPLSKAYPMISMSYIFAIVLAIVFLHESISWSRWVGVALIVAGCMFVAK